MTGGRFEKSACTNKESCVAYSCTKYKLVMFSLKKGTYMSKVGDKSFGFITVVWLQHPAWSRTKLCWIPCKIEGAKDALLIQYSHNCVSLIFSNIMNGWVDEWCMMNWWMAGGQVNYGCAREMQVDGCIDSRWMEGWMDIANGWLDDRCDCVCINEFTSPLVTPGTGGHLS